MTFAQFLRENTGISVELWFEDGVFMVAVNAFGTEFVESAATAAVAEKHLVEELLNFSEEP